MSYSQSYELGLKYKKIFQSLQHVLLSEFFNTARPLYKKKFHTTVCALFLESHYGVVFEFIESLIEKKNEPQKNGH
jgi:hypothetical protein